MYLNPLQRKRAVCRKMTLGPMATWVESSRPSTFDATVCHAPSHGWCHHFLAIRSSSLWTTSRYIHISIYLYNVEPLAGKTTLRPAASHAGYARVVERVLLAVGLDLEVVPGSKRGLEFHDAARWHGAKRGFLAWGRPLPLSQRGERVNWRIL